ncbi:MAG: chorismate synthase [Candidatus Aquicultorales bacterium]
MIRYSTAGESHGQALITIVEGIPSGISLSPEEVARDLARRQLGYGRGGRMKIERDTGEILSGVRYGRTIGSPIAIMIENKDWSNWAECMSLTAVDAPAEPLTKPRPGHADLAGMLKTGQADIRNILERASARETAARVAAGAVAKALLAELGIAVISHVVRIGPVSAGGSKKPSPDDLETVDASPVRCFDEAASSRMVDEIKKAEDEGDSLGGVFEILVYNCPPGLGGFATWQERLDGKIAAALMGVQAIKGVEIGDGFDLGSIPGSQAHDEIAYDPSRGYYHLTNRAGGIEGGLTNGETIVVRAAMKPIPTLRKPLKTVDVRTHEEVSAFKERADVCAVPAAAVVGEAVVALEIAGAATAKFGADCLSDIKAAYSHYLDRLQKA